MTSNSNGGMITMMLSPASLSTTHHQNGDVVLQGYHKKLKTMKRKYFVLLADDDKSPARLEYYDSEKKFKSSKSTKPKRTIHLKNCFNINRRLDTKHDNVIALSTREEVFCMLLDDETEMNKWLKLLLILQRGENIENTTSDTPQPNYGKFLFHFTLVLLLVSTFKFVLRFLHFVVRIRCLFTLLYFFPREKHSSGLTGGLHRHYHIGIFY